MTCYVAFVGTTVLEVHTQLDGVMWGGGDVARDFFYGPFRDLHVMASNTSADVRGVRRPRYLYDAARGLQDSYSTRRLRLLPPVIRTLLRKEQLIFNCL